MSYKIVFADLDKTLLDNNGKITPFTKRTLAALMATGVPFVPCSGRALYSLPLELFDIPGIQYAVTSNGVSIDDMQKRKSIQSLTVPQDLFARLFAFIQRETAPGGAYSGAAIHYECFINGQGYTSQDYWDDPTTTGGAGYKRDYIRATRKPVPDIEAFTLDHRTEIGSFDVIAHPDYIHSLWADLRAAFPDVYITNSEHYLIEIAHKDAGKHHGLERLCAMLGFTAADAVAFGDGNNDVEMLSCAGLAVAVGNASEACKAVAHRVVEPNSEDGVAREICRLFGL